MDLMQDAYQDERSLAGRAAMGDADAWADLVRLHQQPVFRFAYLILGDPEEAEDVAQETFIRAYRSFSQYDQSRSMRPWLMSIAARLAYNRQRSLRRYLAALERFFNSSPHPAEPSAEQESLQNIEARALWMAVQGLPQPYQQVVYMRYFLGLPVQEVAEALSLPDGTVKSRLHRALKQLEGKLQHT